MFVPIYSCIIYLFYFISSSLVILYVWLLCFFSGNDLNQAIRRNYDYIIVGAGTAGITVAHGIHSNDVLLVEAGLFTTSFLDIPLLTPSLQGTDFDWDYYTIEQKAACLALNGQQSRWPRGKGFGGSQILNYMIFNEGHREDYRGWFSPPDAYNYERDILPYYRYIQEDIKPNQNYYKTPLSKAFIDSATEYGYDKNTFFSPNVTVENGLRKTIAHIYRYNKPTGHQIMVGAKAISLIFDSNKKNRAIGIVIERNGVQHRVFARKGIILSAGVLGSPEILLKSGIGPIGSEQRLDILRPLAVGENLQDHITTGIDLVLLNQSLSISSPWDILTPKTLYQFALYGSGPFTMNGCEALGFVNDFNSTEPPKIGFMLLPMGLAADSGVFFHKLLNINSKSWNEYFQPLTGHYSVSILPVVLRPQSRGRLFLQNGNLVIDPMYLTHEDDVETLIRGIRIVKQLIEMSSMQKLGAELNPKPFPGCEEIMFDSIEYWRCYVRHLTLTAFHPVGTCKMGSETDPSAVVDPTFRLIGFENIFIVDASVMPNLPSSNPNSAVYMLAKKFLYLLQL